MIGRRFRLAVSSALIGTIVLLAVALLGPGAAGARKVAGVKLGDNFFKPTTKTVGKGTRVKFKWIGSGRHNVTLKKGPGKRFASRTTSAKGVNFTRRFKKRGTYRIYCTIHATQMNLRLKVR